MGREGKRRRMQSNGGISLRILERRESEEGEFKEKIFIKEKQLIQLYSSRVLKYRKQAQAWTS